MGFLTEKSQGVRGPALLGHVPMSLLSLEMGAAEATKEAFASSSLNFGSIRFG